jgi:hypothetical protein
MIKCRGTFSYWRNTDVLFVSVWHEFTCILFSIHTLNMHNSECGRQVVWWQTGRVSSTATYPFLANVDIYNNIWSTHCTVICSSDLVVALYSKLISWQTKKKVKLGLVIIRMKNVDSFQGMILGFISLYPFAQLVLEIHVIFLLWWYAECYMIWGRLYF